MTPFCQSVLIRSHLMSRLVMRCSCACRLFLVACYATLHPARSVRWSVSRSVGWSPFLLFRRFWDFWAFCSCPNALVTFSSTAPAHPHATGVAVYLALFFMLTDNKKNTIFIPFLVACYATLHPAMSVGRSVGRSVGPLIIFSAFLSLLSLPLLPKCSGDLLQPCSCPPARD